MQLQQQPVVYLDKEITNDRKRNQWGKGCIGEVSENVTVNEPTESNHGVPKDATERSNKSGKQTTIDKRVVERRRCDFGHETRVDTLQNDCSHEDSREKHYVGDRTNAPIVGDFILFV